ncbi:sensor histidine kinase [Variovorax ginsengisoli]|uniref:histidine kinase n=1 Tax=Variovorax ginsengisoli TaxID=363844 RepID=A0ABT8RXQ1_9BURK|nr:histidine kinase [Variovorax ginsengisoli]MDN8612274.1 histidine kinase [Variovorax ginsengisoli]MDO1531444.1 histidine kinase [Variovorax ginsengisoli]
MDAWRLPPRIAALWSLAVAVLLSTQYLFQPFVWENWPWDEVLAGWLEVLGHCIVEGMFVLGALLLASRLRFPSPLAYSCVLMAAVALGTAIGNVALAVAGFQGAAPDTAWVAARTVRWAAISGCSVATFGLASRTSRLRAEAQANDLQRVQLGRQLVQVQLQALRNQIEPHFLFNTLATVRRLHQTEPAEGARLLAYFLDYLHSTLRQQLQGQFTTLGRELDLVRAYLAVVSVRMSGRLQVAFEVPAELRECVFPSLCIATLVENAVKHGISASPSGGEICVQAKLHGDEVEVAVRDTGAGFSGSGGSGVGLANIRARLSTLYGASGVLRVESNKPSGVCASIRLPRSIQEATP